MEAISAWPHPSGSMGLSRWSPLPGPERCGRVRRVPLSAPPRKLTILPNGDVYAMALVGLSAGLSAPLGQQPDAWGGLLYLVRPAGDWEVLGEFGFEDSPFETGAALRGVPALDAQGRAWLYSGRHGFLQVGQLPSPAADWYTPTLTGQGTGAVTVADTLVVGSLGGQETQVAPLPMALETPDDEISPGGIPGEYDASSPGLFRASPPAAGPDGTLYVRCGWYLATEDPEQPQLHVWRLFALPPGGETVQVLDELRVEDDRWPSDPIITTAGGVLCPGHENIAYRPPGGGAFHEVFGFSHSVRMAASGRRAWFTQWGQDAERSAEPQLLAKDLDTGAVLWECPAPVLDSRPPKMAADGDNRLYLEIPGGLVARDARGEVLFEEETGTLSALAIGANRTLVAGVGGEDPALVFIEGG